MHTQYIFGKKSSATYLNFQETQIITSDRQVKNEAFNLDKVKSNTGKINFR